jgi:hypothetical protein
MSIFTVTLTFGPDFCQEELFLAALPYFGDDGAPEIGDEEPLPYQCLAPFTHHKSCGGGARGVIAVAYPALYCQGGHRTSLVCTWNPEMCTIDRSMIAKAFCLWFLV